MMMFWSKAVGRKASEASLDAEAKEVEPSVDDVPRRRDSFARRNPINRSNSKSRPSSMVSLSFPSGGATNSDLSLNGEEFDRSLIALQNSTSSSTSLDQQHGLSTTSSAFHLLASAQKRDDIARVRQRKASNTSNRSLEMSDGENTVQRHQHRHSVTPRPVRTSLSGMVKAPTVSVAAITPAKSDEDFLKSASSFVSKRQSPNVSDSENSASVSSNAPPSAKPFRSITNTVNRDAKKAKDESVDVSCKDYTFNIADKQSRVLPLKERDAVSSLSNDPYKETVPKADGTTTKSDKTAVQNSEGSNTTGAQIDVKYTVRRTSKGVLRQPERSLEMASCAHYQLHFFLHNSKAFHFSISRPRQHTFLRTPIPETFTVRRTVYWIVERSSRFAAVITFAFGT